MFLEDIFVVMFFLCLKMKVSKNMGLAIVYNTLTFIYLSPSNEFMAGRVTERLMDRRMIRSVKIQTRYGGVTSLYDHALSIYEHFTA